jgi:hypothetical protein
MKLSKTWHNNCIGVAAEYLSDGFFNHANEPSIPLFIRKEVN